MSDPERAADGGPRPAASPLSPLSFVLLGAVVAAGLAMWWGARPAERWVVLEAADAERNDGESVDAGDRFPFAMIATTGIGSAELQLDEAIRVLVLPDTRVELPPGPGRWVGRERALRVLEGRVVLTTGARPPDFDLVVLTPQTRTRMAAATFSVERNPLGTRICLGRGRIETESPDGEHVVGLPEGMRVQFYPRGLEPEIGSQTPEEQAHLAQLDRAGIQPRTP